MTRTTLGVLSALWILAGMGIFAQPQMFYSMVPGLAAMGPFNVHFVRDVGLAFLASGGIVAWGVARRRYDLAAAGMTWPVLHGLFHVQIWAHRDFALDAIFAFDLAAVIGPAALGALCVILMRPRKVARQ